MQETIGFQPPVPDSHGSKGGEECTHVDPHIEDQEGIVTHLVIFGIIIQLTHYCLKIPFKEAVSYGNGKESHHDHRIGQPGNGHHYIAQEHDDLSHGNDRRIFLCGVGQNSTKQRQGIDGKIEPAVNITGFLCRKSEFGLQEQYQDRHHGIKTKSLSHIRKESYVETFRMSFQHSYKFL